MSLGPIVPLEPLSRFIFNRRHFNPQKMVASHGAFLPPDRLRGLPVPAINRTLSVCRIIGLREDDVWREGERVGANRTESLKARADIQASAVFETGLSVDAGNMRRRHADIVGWEESLILLKATALAHRAALRLPS
jgi:hypothetical protein